MTREEYQEFSLRYEGCGACFPLFEKLTRFEKMCFTAIQKDVFELEKAYNETEELLDKQTEETYKLFKENAEMKELIKKLVYEYKRLCLIKKETITEVEQFLKGKL